MDPRTSPEVEGSRQEEQKTVYVEQRWSQQTALVNSAPGAVGSLSSFAFHAACRFPSTLVSEAD